jgi:hypothetical protein
LVKSYGKNDDKNYAKAARNSAKKLRKTETKKAAAATFHCIGITSLDGIR